MQYKTNPSSLKCRNLLLNLPLLTNIHSLNVSTMSFNIYMLAITSAETQNNQIFPISMTTSFKTERFLLYSKRTHGTYDLELQK